MTTRASEVDDRPLRLRRWPEALALVAALLGTFLLVGWIGAREAARDQRVLGVLDPLAEWMRTSGQVWWEWLLEHGRVTGWLTTATASAIALAGLIIGRRRAMPLLLLAFAVSLATWGQVELHEDAVELGIWFYASGLVCAAAFGIWMPMSRLDGFPTLPLPRRRRRRGTADPELSAPRQAAQSVEPSLRAWRWECVLVFALGVLALLTRVYALPELPRGVDLEMVESMIASRTGTGMYWYCGDGFWGNGGGLIHMLPRKLIFDLFGTSVYGLRLSSVFLGVLAVPLLYWLVRRIAGIGPAVVSCVLLITAPEQLFWSRNENAHFIPIALLTLICAHLGLWMVQRLSVFAVAAAALWIPFSRLFYTPGSIMFVYPVALYGHALLFVKGAWRKVLYVVPLLALGVTLWFYSFSLLYTFAHPGEWRFIDPTTVYGSSAWRKQGEYMNTPMAELIRLQAVSMGTNFGAVVKGLVFRTPGFSHWYDRYDISPNNHRTTINVGFTLIGVLGLAYLIGQIYERRAFLLVIWVILGVVPGIMSTEPADRRISVMFPGLYVVAGVMVGAVVRMVRNCAGRRLSWVTGGVLGIAIAVVALTSLTSHLLIPTGTNFLDGPIRFAAPYFQKSDAIFYNFDLAVAEGMLLGNVDQFLARQVPPCFELVAPKDWLATAVRLRCRFPNRAATLTMPVDRERAAEAAYHPKRITFLMEDWPHTHAQIELLRELYPHAEAREFHNVNETQLVALTVESADIEALHQPRVVVDAAQEPAAAPQQTVLTGLPPLAVEAVAAPATGSEAPVAASPNTVVRGGLLIEEDDWYRFTLRPACPGATFAVDQRPAPSEVMQPLLSGVHAFEITLPKTSGCRLPLQVLAQSHTRRQPVPVASSDLLSPHVAALPHARSAPAAPYSGYGEATPLTVPPGGTPIDFGIDAQGGLYLLMRGDGWHIYHFDPHGQMAATWLVDLPPERDAAWLTVDPAGTVIVLSHQITLFYDPNGKLVGHGVDPLIWATDVAFWRDRLLMVRADRPAVDVVDRAGALLTEWVQFDGGLGKFVRPGAVVVGPDEQIVVVEGDGDALVFRNDGEAWAPTLVRRFHIDFSELPAHPHGMAFDGPDRIVLPDPPSYNPLVYSLTGERLLAETPPRDLSTRGFGIVQRVRHTDDWLYVLESARRLWRVAR